MLVFAGGDEGLDLPEAGEHETPTEVQDWGNEKLGPISAMSAGPAGKVIVAFAKGRVEKYTCFGRQEEAISKRVRCVRQGAPIPRLMSGLA